MQENNFTIQLILLSTVVILVIGLAAIMLFLLSVKQKRKHIHAEQESRLRYHQEINQAKIDIKDDTLKQVANDLHDNIGQLVLLLRIQLTFLQKKYTNENKLDEAYGLANQVLDEIRRLSNSLNDEWIKEFGLLKSLQTQKQLMEHNGILRVEINCTGNERSLNKEHELILYRICQEFISNTIKYAEAKRININLTYSLSNLQLNLVDDGKGFDMRTIRKGNGLLNIESRATLLDATCKIISEINRGTKVIIQYPYEAV